MNKIYTRFAMRTTFWVVLATMATATLEAAVGYVSTNPEADMIDSELSIIILKDQTVTFTVYPGVDTITSCTGTFENTGGSFDGPFNGSKTVTFGAAAEGNSNNCVITLSTMGTLGEPCTSSKSITFKVKVPKITTLTEVSKPTNRDRTTLGVGEIVKLTVTPSNIGAVAWNIDGGANAITKGTLSASSGLIIDYTASEIATTSPTKVTATFANGKSKAVNFTVIEPSGVHMESTASTGSKNPLKAGFTADCYYLPISVNFYKIQVYEDAATGIGLGYFTPINGRLHAVGSPSGMAGYVIGKGTIDSTPDNVSTNAPVTPYSNGTFTWPIPWRYKLGSTDKVFANPVTHLATLNVAGTPSVATLTQSKAGEHDTQTNP